MEQFILVLSIDKVLYYGGKIEAANIDDADIAAFFIWKALEDEGFVISNIEAYLANQTDIEVNMKVITDKNLPFYLAYYALQYKNNCDGNTHNLISYFERKEDYEKCAFIKHKMEKIIL